MCVKSLKVLVPRQTLTFTNTHLLEKKKEMYCTTLKFRVRVYRNFTSIDKT